MSTAEITLEERAASRRSRLIALIVAASFFMQALDSTIITTALPAMATSFHIRPSDLSIGITAYLLSLAALVPISGWLADRLGPRDVFAGAIVVFTLASILCALAPNLWTFVAARLLQGVGGSFMGPVGRLVVLRTTQKKDLLNAIALIVWPALAAPIIGPALGGYIVTYATWPWIFLVNVPLGIIGLGLVLAFIPNPRSETRAPFDWAGFALSAGSLVFLISGLEAVSHSREPWTPAGLIGLGLLLGFTAFRRFKTHPHPLIPLDALRVQTFTTATLWGGAIFRMTVFATPFLLPLMFQVGFGFSPIRSGLMLLAYFAGNLAIKPATTGILRLFGFRQTLLVNGMLSGLFIACVALFTPATPMPMILGVLALAGGFRSMQFTCLDSLAYADIPPENHTGATTLWSVVDRVSAVLGIAMASITLNLAHVLRGADAIAAIDFRIAFVCVGLLSVVSMPAYLRLPRNAGAEVTGHA